MKQYGPPVFSGLQQSRHSVVPAEPFSLWQRQDVAAQIGQCLELAAVRQFDRREAGEVGIPVHLRPLNRDSRSTLIISLKSRHEPQPWRDS